MVSGRTTARSSVTTAAAIAVCAYAACDMIHEIAGHGTAVLFSPSIRALSLSTVALQTSGESRMVAAAGTVANLIAGIFSLVLGRRIRRFGAARYFFLLLGALNLLNGTGYFLFSSVFGTGDWAVVIAGLKPHPAWRIGLGLVGVTSYVVVIYLAAREFTQLVCSGLLAPEEIGRLIYVAYLAGGVLLVAGAAMNPISERLIFVSGASTGFGAMAGLLFVPGIVQRRVRDAHPVDGNLRISRPWIAAGILCGVIFIAFIGPGIRL